MAIDSGGSTGNSANTNGASGDNTGVADRLRTVARRARFRVVSKHQVSGWRFLLGRIEHALVRRDASMRDDPARGRALALLIGVALACVCVAAAAVLSFFKPAKIVGNARIIADKDSGALYVNIQGRLYPALNLSSARLIIGSPENPVQVPAAELEKYPRGPLVGIPGAPGRMVASTDRDSYWTVCATARIGAATPLDPNTGLPTVAAKPVWTTVIGGQPTVDDEGVRELGATEARLMREDKTNWLVYYHHDKGVVRAMIDLGDAPVLLALGIDATAPVLPTSRGMLEAIPEVPALRLPDIPGKGSDLTLASGYTTKVGAVLTVGGQDRPAAHYVVIQSGVVPVSPVLAAMLRNAEKDGSAAFHAVAANVVSQSLRPGGLPSVATYPSERVQLADATTQPVTCYAWSRLGNAPTAITRLLVGSRLPLNADLQTQTVNLVSGPQSDGATADSAFLPRNSGRYVQLTGTDRESALRESLWWISDSGVRYGIDAKASNTGTDQTLTALGIGSPIPAPWGIVTLLAPGPTLSQRDARIQHDGIAPDPIVAVLPSER